MKIKALCASLAALCSLPASASADCKISIPFNEFPSSKQNQLVCNENLAHIKGQLITDTSVRHVDDPACWPDKTGKGYIADFKISYDKENEGACSETKSHLASLLVADTSISRKDRWLPNSAGSRKLQDNIQNNAPNAHSSKSYKAD